MGVRGGGQTYPVSVRYYDLARAVGQLWRHPDGVRLQVVVEMWMGSATTEQIGDSLAVSQRQAERLLNAAFRWVCDADGGGFVSPMSRMSPAGT